MLHAFLVFTFEALFLSYVSVDGGCSRSMSNECSVLKRLTFTVSLKEKWPNSGNGLSVSEEKAIKAKKKFLSEIYIYGWLI